MASKSNKLEVGQSRIGLMIDGLPETPRVAVKLERTGSRVELTIPFLEGHNDIYQYWFSSGAMYGDDPLKVKRRYEPPESISFFDVHGAVGLIGSQVSASRVTLGGADVGEGRLVFDYTVLGASDAAGYESINGLRSEVEGLGTWIGLRSLDAVQTRDEAGRLKSVSLQLQRSPAIPAGRRLNAEFQANWRYGPGPGPDQTTITERMQIHTQIRKAVPWDKHLEVQFPLRNLLRLAAWRQLDFVSHEVMSEADPIRTLDGKAHGNQWFPVITNRTGIRSDSPTRSTERDFLFAFGDVGSRGVGRWVNLSRKFERGVGPLVDLLELEGASLEAHLAQVGIAFEMLGYDLLLEAKVSKTKANKAKFADLAAAVTSTVADVLPFPSDEFPGCLRRVYVGVKHADNARPDRAEMEFVYWQAIQVFRAWVASRLGMSKPRLRAALENDRLTRRIRHVQGSVEQPGSATATT